MGTRIEYDDGLQIELDDNSRITLTQTGVSDVWTVSDFSGNKVPSAEISRFQTEEKFQHTSALFNTPWQGKIEQGDVIKVKLPERIKRIVYLGPTQE